MAACATVDEIGNESGVMKRTLPAFAVILAVYMLLTMLYNLRALPQLRGLNRIKTYSFII